MISPKNGRFSIGRQIISREKVVQVREEIEFVQFDIGSEILWNSIAVYGITKSIGIELTIPVFFHRKLAGFTRRGLSDIALQAQWQFYRTPEHNAQLMTGLSFPSGHSMGPVRLGTGSYDILLALSFIHASDHWFASVLFGPDITTKRNFDSAFTRRASSALNYEFLFGPKFSVSCMNKGKLAVLFELDGEYVFREKINDIEQFDSGGNIAIFGPLISFEHSNSIIIQGRIQLPITQRLFGPNKKIEYVAGISIEANF